MLKIGLTGGIGSGKSTVSAMLKGAGFPIIDADVIARNVLDKYPEIISWVRKEYGDGFFDWQGNFLRRQFGNYIFKYPKERVKYEEKIMPFIKQDIFLKVKSYEQESTPLVIIDAPTLIENNIHEEMNYVILVWVDKNTQIQRVKHRDKLIQSEIMSRINSQISLEEKKLYADFIIDNSGTLESTRQQVNDIAQILNMYK